MVDSCFFFSIFLFLSFCWGTRRYQPDIQNGLPSIDGFVLLGSGHDDDGDAARLAKVTLRVSSARQVCSMFSIARRGLEKAAAATTEETKEAGVNEARVALLHALRRAERVLVNRDDEVRVFFFSFFFLLLVCSDDKHRDYYRYDSFAAVNFFFFLFLFLFFLFVFFLLLLPLFFLNHRLIIVQ